MNCNGRVVWCAGSEGEVGARGLILDGWLIVYLALFFGAHGTCYVAVWRGVGCWALGLGWFFGQRGKDLLLLYSRAKSLGGTDVLWGLREGFLGDSGSCMQKNKKYNKKKSGQGYTEMGRKKRRD